MTIRRNFLAAVARSVAVGAESFAALMDRLDAEERTPTAPTVESFSLGPQFMDEPPKPDVPESRKEIAGLVGRELEEVCRQFFHLEYMDAPADRLWIRENMIRAKLLSSVFVPDVDILRACHSILYSLSEDEDGEAALLRMAALRLLINERVSVAVDLLYQGKGEQ